MVSLLFTNLLTIGIAFYQGWSLSEVMWVYWIQSVIIGIFQYKKILDLKNFTTSGIKFNGKPVAETDAGKKSIAYFFLFHYGGFHLVYLIFLLALHQKPDLFWFFLLAISYFINHYRSYKSTKVQDAKRTQSLQTLIVKPYKRILPMHAVIVLGTMMSPANGVLLFLSLKTATDLLGHYLEHKTS